jgi:hypothetical protein
MSDQPHWHWITAFCRPDCRRCKGTCTVSHDCDCQFCKVQTQPCDECQRYKHGRILGGLTDRERIGKVLTAAPPSASVFAHRDGGGRLKVWAVGWRAVFGAIEASDKNLKAAVGWEPNP